ncbi:MAG: DNA-binding protein [Pseudobdellovibrio sp.]
MTQASEFLNLKLSRLRYEVFHKRIPYFKVGRSIRFEEKELTVWLMNQKQEVTV